MPNPHTVPFLDLRALTLRKQARLQAAFSAFLESGHYILGAHVEKFEREFAAYCGTRHCIGVANGLDALILILEGFRELGVMTAGDEIIVPANTYIASILAISRAGLTPVLVEPDPATYNLNPARISEKVTGKTKGILVAHLYGAIADMTHIRELGAAHGLKVIEDAAQAHGARYETENGSARAGALGDAAGFSFYPSKNLGALGDGGAITTDDDALAQVLRALRNYGSPAKNQNQYKGHNSRLDEIQASVLSIQLEYLETDNTRRREIAQRYLMEIKNPHLTLPRATPDPESVWHLFVVRAVERDALQHHLADRGIETAVHYPVPPHKQKAYAEWNHLSFPITEALHREVLSLPMGPHLADDQVSRVIAAVNSYP